MPRTKVETVLSQKEKTFGILAGYAASPLRLWFLSSLQALDSTNDTLLSNSGVRSTGPTQTDGRWAVFFPVRFPAFSTFRP